MSAHDGAPAATGRTDRAPGPPVLSRGRHAATGSGVCLMEFTALLAGDDLTDRPRSVHPLVSAVARVVNDSVSDAVRDDLLSRGPLSLCTATDDAGTADRITLTVIEAALPVALPIWAPRLRRERRRILSRRGRTQDPVTPRRMRSAEKTVTMAAACLACAPIEHPDAELIRLLDDVLAVVAAPGSTAAPVPPTPPGRELPRPRAAAVVDTEVSR